MHETAASVLFDGIGIGWLMIDQLAPFHRSIVPGDAALAELPTAKQLVEELHATPLRLLPVALGFGLAPIDHVEPFQRSTRLRVTSPFARVPVPTAKQLVVVAHDTSASEFAIAPDAFALAMVVQVAPFQRRIRVLFVDACAENTWTVPTAKHEVALGHETELSAGSVVEVGAGLATIDHVVPFQCSMSVRGWLPSYAEPTAEQLLAVAHATPSKYALSVFAGCGLATIDHVAPSHFSTTVCVPERPTAKQPVVLVHATDNNADGPAIAGVGAVDQVVPSQLSMKALLKPPTAKQLVALGQATSLMESPAGSVTIDHCAPFNCSITSPLTECPTAKQVVGVAHATLVSAPFGAPGGLLLDRTDHDGD